jgi:hypothetical protein
MTATTICPTCNTPQRFTARGLLVDHYITVDSHGRGRGRMRQRCPGSRKPARKAA